MLTIRDLRKTVGGRTLFENATFTVNYAERVALVGPNGAGKSTLFNIILGLDEADSGAVERDEWTMVGFLPQESAPVGDETVMDVATGRSGEIPQLEKQLKELEAAGNVDGPEYLQAHAKHEALSNPQVEAKAKKMLRGLGYKEEHFSRPAKEMSGGWVMRAHLARLLVMEPDLLLLDEPTNHLDLLSLLWLQDYLKTYSGAILMISHDRQFMDEIVESVHEIAEQKLIGYTGTIPPSSSNAKIATSSKIRLQESAEGDRQPARVYDRFRQVASKASQAMSKLKQIERMELIEKPLPPRSRSASKSAAAARRIARHFAGEDPHGLRHTQGLRGLDLEIERGERPCSSGRMAPANRRCSRSWRRAGVSKRLNAASGLNAKIGLLQPASRPTRWTPPRRCSRKCMDCAPTLSENEARGILGLVPFRKEEIYKKTGVLSGGEKSRLNLIKFLVDPPNLLLMDEPTTHLDIHTVESLILALEAYEGTLVFISHDVHFIRKLATKVLHVSGGKAMPYPGGYDYFLEKTGALSNERAALTAS
jgi:ATP-binding cassette subfamily F protein 3